jgi:hypothetical protein
MDIPPLPGAVAGAIIVLLFNLKGGGLSRIPPLLENLN